MAQSNDITSTEKLLDVIRGKNADQTQDKIGAASPKPFTERPPKGKIKLIRTRQISFSKPVTVGVDIGPEYLRMVMTTRGAGSASDFINHKRVPITPSQVRNSTEFANFLQAELNAFCGAYKNVQLWAIMSATNVEVRHIRVPQVAKKQIENVVFWTIKKETPVDENESILNYQVLGEVNDKGVAKLEVMYCTAPRLEVEEQKKLFSRAGWPLTGLSIAPFAIQNIFRTQWMPSYEGKAAILFIGTDFSRIDIYSDGNLVVTRGIKAGINSMLELLVDGINEKISRSGDGLSRAELDNNKAKEILNSLSPDTPDLTEEARYGLTKEEIWEMVLPALERQVRQVERTFDYFTINLGNEKVEKIYVSGEMNDYRRISDYIAEQLGIPSDIFDPLNPEKAYDYGTNEMFPVTSERIAIAPVLGISLSDKIHTPNFLFNYRDKQTAARVRRINMMIISSFIVCASLCAGYFLYELVAMHGKNQNFLMLDKQLSQYTPQVNQDMIMQTVAVYKKNVTTEKAYYQKYEGLALVAEISNLSSPNIRLLNLKTNLGAAQGKPKEVEIEGVVLGERKFMESSLGDYLLKLDSSPLFNQVKIQKTTEEVFRKGTMLRFTATMKMEGV